MTGVRVSETVAARVSWALLGEWWCVRADASEDECAKIIAESFALSVPRDLVRDRLFGGFHCAQDAGRRHVYFGTGHYTYLNPEKNTPLSDEERRKTWAEVIKASGEEPGNGPFTHAGPA